jgi:hypothetical protein
MMVKSVTGKVKTMYENLRELSNSLTARVYLLNTGEIVITR